MKVTGRGMALSPDKFTLSVTPDGIMLDHEGPRPEYRFFELPACQLTEGDRYCHAYCLKAMPEGHRVVCRDVDLMGNTPFNGVAR